MKSRSRLRIWWWKFRNQTVRHIFRKPDRDKGENTRQIMVRVRQTREAFGDWVDDEGYPHHYDSVSWPNAQWDELDKNGFVVD